MFTGLVQHLGRVAMIDDRAFGRRLMVDVSGWNHAPAHGESIAVDGCCLTVAEIAERERDQPKTVAFDVIQQTLGVTTLGRRRVGDRVNLECAVTPTTLMGGHIVQGHIDGVAEIIDVTRTNSEHRLRIAAPSAHALSIIVEKGSIAINGVSLTVARVGDAWFEVALIPTTLALTNLGELALGDEVNVEYDYIAKVVANWLARRDADR